MDWDLPDDLKRKLFWDNAVRFYRRFPADAIPEPSRSGSVVG
jgi:hypothetical protein